MHRRSLARVDALVLTAGLWFVAKFLRYAFPPLFPAFRDIYGLSNAELGLAFTGLMVTYAATQFPSGTLADRFGPVRVVAGGALLAALAALALSTTTTTTVLVAAMLVIGLGTGVHKTVAVALLSRVYPATTGRALGVHDTVGSFGGVAAPALAVSLLDGPGWGVLFLAASLVGAALAAGFARYVPRRLPERPAAGTGDGAPLRAYVHLFAERRVAAYVFVAVGVSVTTNGVFAFLPLYLTDAAGLDSGLAGLLYSVLFAVSLVQLVSGELGDRHGTLAVSVGMILLAALGLVGLLVARRPLWLGVAVVVFGLGNHGFRPVRGAHLVDRIPMSLAGGGLGVVRTILMGAGALSPALVGGIAEYASFRAAFTVLLAALAASGVVAIGLLVTE